VVYEGYGPGGAAVLIEALTDNRHRTSGNIKHAFSAHGGNLGATGSVQWMFDKLDGEWTAKYPVELEESQKKEVIELLEALDDDEDVSAVYCNAALGDIDEIV
jgi:transcriptional/translational regulatory protein YebC/TACO1